MTCPLCKTKMEAEVKLTGGCSGHFGEDDRCYCDSADVHLEFSCPNHVRDNWVRNENPNARSAGKWVRNKHFCKQENLKVGELSDQNAMARWFTEHYVPGDKANIF